MASELGENNQQVNGRDVWGKTHWKKHTGKKICDTDQSKCISIGHVSVHQKNQNPEAMWNQMADHLAKINVLQNLRQKG